MIFPLQSLRTAGKRSGRDAVGQVYVSWKVTRPLLPHFRARAIVNPPFTFHSLSFSDSAVSVGLSVDACFLRRSMWTMPFSKTMFAKVSFIVSVTLAHRQWLITAKTTSLSWPNTLQVLNPPQASLLLLLFFSSLFVLTSLLSWLRQDVLVSFWTMKRRQALQLDH